jgi:hypothetical protein
MVCSQHAGNFSPGPGVRASLSQLVCVWLHVKHKMLILRRGDNLNTVGTP